MPKFIVSLLLLFALLAIFIHSWMQLIAYIGILSTLAFLLFGIDKFCARKGCRRVPEAALLILCFAGGSAGALAGQLVFRHKTRKGNRRATRRDSVVFPRLQTLFKSQRRCARRKENTWAFVGNYQVDNEQKRAALYLYGKRARNPNVVPVSGSGRQNAPRRYERGGNVQRVYFHLNDGHRKGTPCISRMLRVFEDFAR